MRTYDRTVTLERFGLAEDAYGDEREAWAPLKADVPARRRLAPGRERLASAEVAASAPFVFYIPWSPEYADLSPADRVIHEGRAMDISSAIEVGRRREIEITATARVG